MRVVRNAIADRLLALPQVTTNIATFYGEPAIFTRSPVPPAASGRFIVIRDSHIDEPFETKTPSNPPADYVATMGREVHHDIGIYQDQTGDSSDLEDLALYIRKAFNRYPLSISGYGTLIARTSGPIEAPASEEQNEEVDGRLITVILTVIEKP
jgi:hypothetical protein